MNDVFKQAFMCRDGSRATATSKMEYFVIIVNDFQPLTIMTKRSILDVASSMFWGYLALQFTYTLFTPKHTFFTNNNAIFNSTTNTHFFYTF